jgi:hypothetical protein
MKYAQYQGIAFLVIGIAIVLWSIGSLLIQIGAFALRLLVAIVGLILINKGLTLRKLPNLQQMAARFLFRRNWF